MGLIFCRECGKKVSDTAHNCVHCGALIKKDNSIKNELSKETNHSNKVMPTSALVILIFFGIVLLIGLIGMFTIPETNNDSNITSNNLSNNVISENVGEYNSQKEVVIIDLDQIESICNDSKQIYSDYEMDNLKYIEIPSKITSEVCFDYNNIIVKKSVTNDFLNIYNIRVNKNDLKYRLKIPYKTTNSRIILSLDSNFNYIEIENSINLDYLGGIGKGNLIVFDSEYYWIKLFDDGGIDFKLINESDIDCCWNE